MRICTPLAAQRRAKAWPSAPVPPITAMVAGGAGAAMERAARD
jgi:hypothetical protein